VALILHLSDLHLTPNAKDDVIGDYKVNVIPVEQRQTRRRLLEQTLASLREDLATRDLQLDAVVVSGDVTYQGDRHGFELLPQVLAKLGDRTPPPEKTVVIPGNHDVAWGTNPSSPQRYQDFVETIGAHGYRVPLVPGAGAPWDASSRQGPLLVDPDGLFAIVAINSADYCGVNEPLGKIASIELEDLEKAGAAPTLRDELARLRLFDIARVDPAQLDALRGIISGELSGRSPRPVRLAAIHHQLLPVTPMEEVKPFEGLTNLAEVRAFLGGNGIDVVLHGHKHVAGVYEDRFPVEANPAGSDEEYRLIVCSAGTTGPGAGVGTEVGKLIEVVHDLPNLRRVRITGLAATSGGAPLRLNRASRREFPVGRQYGGAEQHGLTGNTASDLHELILELFADDRQRRDVICRWSDGPSALKIPPTYPTDRLEGDAAAWFNDTVKWWQDPESAPDKPWTHGQRIRAWRGKIDQVQTAAQALNQEIDTSRGVVTLLDPERDRVASYTHKFPAFVLAQFWIDDGKLHGSATFRKQEMRYWWPINAAELAGLQRDLIVELDGLGRPLEAGGLTTFTTEAVIGNSPPKVAVPLLDRAVWTDEAQIWRVALAVFDPAMPGREDELSLLVRYMRDWTPADTAPPDGPPIPSRGLDILLSALEALQQNYESQDAVELITLLQAMAGRNEAYREKSEETKQPAQAYGRWRGATVRDLDSFISAVDRLRASPTSE
jgi:hypothetical protein